jgi:hypothetical protein
MIPPSIGTIQAASWCEIAPASCLARWGTQTALVGSGYYRESRQTLRTTGSRSEVSLLLAGPDVRFPPLADIPGRNPFARKLTFQPALLSCQHVQPLYL